jgi:hypothetical protein
VLFPYYLSPSANSSITLWFQFSGIRAFLTMHWVVFPFGFGCQSWTQIGGHTYVTRARELVSRTEIGVLGPPYTQEIVNQELRTARLRPWNKLRWDQASHIEYQVASFQYLVRSHNRRQ